MGLAWQTCKIYKWSPLRLGWIQVDFYKIHILRQKIRLNVHVKLIFISTNLPKLQKIKETLNIPGCPCANVPAADVKIFSILSKLSAPGRLAVAQVNITTYTVIYNVQGRLHFILLYYN